MSRQRRKRKYLGSTDVSHDFLMAFVSLMVGLLLIFFFFITVTISDYSHVDAEEEKEDVVEEELIPTTDSSQQKEGQIQNNARVKADIIKEIESVFTDSNLSIDIDSTGAIRFEGELLFDTGSDSISQEGQKRLEQFIPEYISILLSPRYRDSISQIIVEGHTDDSGSYLFNLTLSQRRAHSVATIIFDENFKNFPYKEDLKSFISASGRSFSKPIYLNGTYDADKSRRVEFLFYLKDEGEE